MSDIGVAEIPVDEEERPLPPPLPPAKNALIDGPILRTLLVPISPTNTFPARSTPTEYGNERNALVARPPSPGAEPNTEYPTPATVVMVPVDFVTFRTVAFP